MDSNTSSKAYSTCDSALCTKVEDRAEQLVSSGEDQMLQEHFSEALEAFQKATEILGNTRPDLYYRQGLALFEYGNEEGREQVLLLANKKFKLAHQLDPYAPDIVHAWGNALTLLGERLEEHHFILSAKEKYEKALGLGEYTGDLLWDYAIVWYYIGVHSGEPIDFQQAIQFFEKAQQALNHLSNEFWIDFGLAILEFATRVKDTRQMNKAVNCFRRALSQDNHSPLAWNYLSESLQILHEHTHDEDYFTQGNECFSNAIKYSPQDANLWLLWGQFLLHNAYRTKSLKRIRACLEKCHHAYAYDCNNPIILSTWAEALLLLGEQTDRLDLIYEAENKLSEAIEMEENDPAIWHSLGLCFCSFGKYFNDYDYYYQAIEKFQTGLSIDRTYDPLWHAIGNTYVKVGVLEDDIESIVLSLKFYEKALAISPSSTRHVDYAIALSKVGEMNRGKKWLELAIHHFEIGLHLQKNIVYLHPEWLYSYASTLDLLGDYFEEEKYYYRAIEIFTHILMIDPDYHRVHQRLAQTFCHLGELLGEIEPFHRAVHHLRIALKYEEENDSMILDWGIALINIAQHAPVLTDVQQLMQEAEQKIVHAAKLGNAQAYYHLSCLYSLLGQYDQSMYFFQKADAFHALPPIEDLLHDEWLEGLRMTPTFQNFLEEHPYLKEES